MCGRDDDAEGVKVTIGKPTLVASAEAKPLKQNIHACEKQTYGMQTGFGKGHPFPLLPAPLYPSVSLTPPSAPTSQWSVSGGKASGIAAAQIPPEDSSQRRQLQRLGDVLIHADRLGGLHILGKGAGGYGDNRHTLAVIARAAADGAGRIVAIHPRHLNVHEYHVVISVGAGG